jgi:hypothetical protein
MVDGVYSTQEFGMASIKGPWVLGGLWKASVLKEDPFPAPPSCSCESSSPVSTTP